MPCNQRVNKPNGDLLAVVGLDFLVDSVLENLELAKPKHVKEVLLLNQQGEILLSSIDKGKQVDSLKRTDNNKSKDKVLLKQSRVLASIQDGQKQGLIKDAKYVYVYARLQFVPWTLLYKFDDSIWDVDL